VWGLRAILIVEDDRSSRDRYKQWFSEEHHVRVAESDSEARFRLDRSIDVVLVNQRLLGSDGLSVEAVQARTGDCRIVVVTPPMTTSSMLDNDVDEHVVRPLSREDLLSTVTRSLTKTADDRGLESFYSLVATKARLETELVRDHPARSEQFQRLCRRVSEVHRQLRETVAAAEADWDEMFSMCGPGPLYDGPRPV
jgi:DNA-binding NtrC family response regulator